MYGIDRILTNTSDILSANRVIGFAPKPLKPFRIQISILF